MSFDIAAIVSILDITDRVVNFNNTDIFCFIGIPFVYHRKYSNQRLYVKEFMDLDILINYFPLVLCSVVKNFCLRTNSYEKALHDLKM